AGAAGGGGAGARGVCAGLSAAGGALRVAPAARLSAGFPYVSPLCRADRGCRQDPDPHRDFLKNAHVVDGGYVDNEGAFTVVDWVSRLLDKYSGTEDRPFDRVFIVRVQ